MAVQDTPALQPSQVKSAVKALVAHLSKPKPADKNSKKSTPESLLGTDVFLWLILTTKKMPEKASMKPIPILLPHSVLPEDAEICLITKDPQREYKDAIEAQGVKRISKVIGVSKLKARYKPFEAKRQLCASYQLFLADERVLPLLPPILGKTFFDKKKHPVPVCLAKKDIKAEIEQTLHSTFVHMNKGVCVAVKIGSLALSNAQNVENIIDALPLIVKKIPGKWDNILSVHLKSSESIALPIYSALPEGPVTCEDVAVEKVAVKA